MSKGTRFFWLLLLPLNIIRAQDIRMELTDRAEDAQYTKLIMVSNVFLLQADSVANPLDISSALPDDEVIWKKIIRPQMNSAFRAGYAWTFDGSNTSEFGHSHTLLLIENPSQTAYPAQIWVDRNHNLNLTDDGPPDTMYTGKGVEIALGHSNGYRVYLEHFPWEKFNSFAAMNDKAVRMVQGNRQFLGTAASFREKRLNVVSGFWTQGNDSFRLGIKDVNCNGLYNEDHDEVMVSGPRQVFDNLQAVNLNNGKAYLEWQNSSIEIKEADPEGRWVRLYRDTTARLRYSLNKGDKLPRFKYCSATKPSRHKSIRRLKGKYVYIYIWRDGIADFYRDSADWHALGRLTDPDFEVLGLNYGASARYVYQYNNIFETAVRQGYSSNEINRRLKVRQIPEGILIDPRQRVVAVGVRPGEVRAILKTLQH